MGSILTEVKKTLNLAAGYTAFDEDIKLYINGVFSTLAQLGIGPEIGYAIEDATPTWDDFLGGDLQLNSVKTYMYLRVRMLFDPPQTGFLMEALQKQISELEWRMNTYRESYAWEPPPTSEVPVEELVFLDGGES